MNYLEQIEMLKKSHESTAHLKREAFDYMGILADRLGVLAVRMNSLEDDCLNVCGMDRADYISTSLVLATEELINLRSGIIQLLAKEELKK